MPNRQIQVKPLFATEAVASVCLSDKYGWMPPAKGKPRPGKGRPAFKNNVRAIRESFGLTIEELAGRAGISTSYLSRIERDGRNLSLKKIDALAGALGVERDTLIIRESSAQRPAAVPFPWHEWQKLRPTNRETVIRMIKGFPEVSEDINEEEDSLIPQPSVFFGKHTDRPSPPAKKSK